MRAPGIAVAAAFAAVTFFGSAALARAGSNLPVGSSAQASLSPRTPTTVDPGIRSVSPRLQQGLAPLGAAVTSARTVLVILADWGSQAPASGVTYAPAAPSDSVTTSEAQTQIGTTDTAWYQSVSYGQFAGWKAQATGWFAIATPPLDSDGCGNAFRATIQSEANGAAQAAGYNPSGYDVVMYYFSNVPCGWAGWTIGSNIWINGAMGTTGVTVHELGHTLGLGHAHSYPCYDNSVTLAASAFGDPNAPCPAANQLPEEYGDPYDVMGQAYNGGPASAGSFTAMQSDYLGWMGSRETTATGPSRYTIAPLEEQSAALHAVKVVDGSETFWVEYRQAIGVDAWLSGYPQATAGVRILLQGPDDEGFAAPGSYLLDTTPDTTGNFYDAALPIGATFRDPLGTLAITLVSADASGATISIQGKRATTVAVSCSPNAVAPGDVSNCTAAVADDSPGTQSAPTGTVTAATSGAGTFPSGASCILSATSTSAATCSMTYSSLTPGARYDHGQLRWRRYARYERRLHDRGRCGSREHTRMPDRGRGGNHCGQR